jgi:ParB-like chromosome segregation protein Spo0J
MAAPTIYCSHMGTINPTELLDHPENPNTHPKEQIEALTKSISRFGWRHPIVVSERSGFIVAGHCRKQAAILLECEAPVDLQQFADEGEELAVLLLDNVIPELADMDEEMLDAGKTRLEELDFKLEEIGFLAEEEKELKGVLLDESLRWNILVECATEQKQAELLTLFESEGIKCKALIM